MWKQHICEKLKRNSLQSALVIFTENSSKDHWTNRYKCLLSTYEKVYRGCTTAKMPKPVMMPSSDQQHMYSQHVHWSEMLIFRIKRPCFFDRLLGCETKPWQKRFTAVKRHHQKHGTRAYRVFQAPACTRTIQGLSLRSLNGRQRAMTDMQKN